MLVNDDLAFATWCVILGALLIAMTAGRAWIARQPLSPSMLYLATGFAVGPGGFGLLTLDPVGHAAGLERLAEIAVLIALFVAGFKLGDPRYRARWGVPVRLASLAMVATVGLIALAGFFLLGLPLGAAVLLGAILAPTDPVLASDVQLARPGDRDRLRFGLTGEGALNDGTAFPFVMLGLGLMGLHDIGVQGWRWWVVDVAWAVSAGLLAGFALGTLTGRLVLWLQCRPQGLAPAPEFIALGLVALAYGVALLVHTYGFLAVFAAGFAFRRVAQSAKAASTRARPTDPSLDAVQHFNEQIERFAEIAVVVAIGALAGAIDFRLEVLWFVPLVFVAIRPIAVSLGTLGTPTSTAQRALMAWFGIRGAGSLYYLMFAITHGLPRATADRLAGLTLAVVVASIVVHGISVTPLMDRYERRKKV